MEIRIDSIEAAIAQIARGGMVVVVDDPDRENEGDLVMAADRITAEAVNFMASEGRGLICAAMREQRLDQLRIPAMVECSGDHFGTAFRVPVDSADRVSTGISAPDRARTIAALAEPGSGPEDFVRPGHVFPLAARDDGVLVRAGHTEASVDLCALAGLREAGVICEIAADDGEMARLPDLRIFADRHGLPLVTIADLIAYRRSRTRLIQRVASAPLPVGGARFQATGYRDLLDGREHVALTLGDVGAAAAPLVRVHSECLTGDVLGSERCDCGDQLRRATEKIAAEGVGAIVYLRGHEGRGIGLLEKLRAYEMQDRGLDTVEANLALGHPSDRRDYGIGMQILCDLGIAEMRLLTNNPAKRAGLEGHGLKVRGCVPLLTPVNRDNVTYLRTKEDRLGHTLDSIAHPHEALL